MKRHYAGNIAYHGTEDPKSCRDIEKSLALPSTRIGEGESLQRPPDDEQRWGHFVVNCQVTESPTTKPTAVRAHVSPHVLTGEAQVINTALTNAAQTLGRPVLDKAQAIIHS